LRVVFFCVSLLLGFALPVSAVSFYGNQSNVRWKSASTEHFNYHYPSEYQVHAAQIGGFAEAVYDSITQRYHSELPGKVNLVIRNSLFSNGEANPVYNMMNVWLTDWDFKVRSTHNWMRDVVTHEFSHLVSIQSGSKAVPFMHGFQFSYQDFTNERSQENALAVFPFSLMPIWFAEGTAQYESSRMGFDAWDTHRDMLLRVAALHDDILPLEYMHDFPEDALGSERGPYNQGFSLVRYIAKTYGDAAVPAIWAELRHMHRSTMDGALRQSLGISEVDLYNKWKAERIGYYQGVRERLGTLRMGIKRTRDASFQDYPTLAGGSLYGLSNFGGPGLEGDLFRVPLRLDTLSGERKPDSSGVLELSLFAEPAFQTQKAWMEQGISVQSTPAGPLLAYVTYRNRDRSGKAYFDIMVADTLGKHRPVTHLADAVYPNISPDARSVVFVRREADGTRFHLSRAPIVEVDGRAEDYVDLYSPPDSVRYFGLYTPRYSPDGTQIAFSLFDGKSRQVAIIGNDGKNMRIVAAGDFDARDPAWSPDGKSLYYSCDRSGIYNIYRLDLASSAVTPITRVLGGAFSPTVDSSGLFYIGYDHDGFSLYQLPSDSLAQNLAPDTTTIAPQVERPKALEIRDIEFAGVQRNYQPIPRLPVLVPLLSIEERAPDFGAVSQGVAVPKAGFAMGLQDPLQKNYLQAALLVELGNGLDVIGENGLEPSLQSDLMLALENRSFPITLGLAYLRRNITARDTVHYEDPSIPTSLSHYAVSVNAIQAGAGYSIFKKGDSLAVLAGYDWASFNLYEDGFAWDYHKRASVGSSLSWIASKQVQQSNASGAGTGALLAYNVSRSELFRPGTFAESFTVSSQGVITPHYRTYQLHEGALALFGSIANPLHSGARLAAGLHGNGLLAWSGPDTLDNFYRYPLALDGYPLLLNSETYNRQGQRTAVAELHYLFPLYNDWRNSFWIFTTRDLYLDIFAQTGNAWDQSGFPASLKERETWDRSVGLEWRWSNRVFYTYPLDISLKLARGLDRVGQRSDGSGGHALHPVDLPVVPEAMAPTQIRFSVGMGFTNSWMGHKSAYRAIQ